MKKMPTHPVFCLCLLSVALLMTGCAGVLESDKPAEHTWWLEPVMLEPREGNKALALDLSVVPGLDSDHVLTLSDDARLNHFAGARWPDHLPEVLESLISRSLESSNQFPAIENRAYAREGECLLILETERFFARVNVQNEANAVEVAMSGRFQCGEEAKELKLQAVRKNSGPSMPEIIDAFQEALDDMTRQVAGQLSY